MLSLTHAARQLISEMLSDVAHGIVLRISASSEGPQISTDRIRIGDDTFNFGGKCVLAVDQMVLRKIAGYTLDVDVVDGQSKLMLTGE
jgi:hypothetical protein